MIRRQPTLIPMTDLDVQDVRDHVNTEKQHQAREPTRYIGPDSMVGLSHLELQDEKERRLGIKNDAPTR
ncbi:hypothetical protein HGRIS_002548 [Hohenbuehelia grisea]|uniref:Uncharacterized protein n=1 Tax=Hohenbuehelia grisea TaxID=104357 RepID=A0ABR3JKY7_9AGAR